MIIKISNALHLPRDFH